MIKKNPLTHPALRPIIKKHFFQITDVCRRVRPPLPRRRGMSWRSTPFLAPEVSGQPGAHAPQTSKKNDKEDHAIGTTVHLQ